MSTLPCNCSQCRAKNGTAWLSNPELHAKLDQWRQEDQAKEAKRPHNKDFEGWVLRIAQKFDSLDHEGGRVVAQYLRELATEIRILGQHEPISAAEFSARQEVMRGSQEAQDTATLECRLSEGWDIPGEC